MRMNLASAKAESLGHLGLVASTLHDLDLMNKIDDQLGRPDSIKVGYGDRVAAMVLNGLGFTNTSLYMTPRFFHDKPMDLLFGKEIAAESFNDDCLGRCLDKISAYGVTKWYSELAFDAVKSAGMLSSTTHLDSSTLSLYGSYDGYENTNGLRPCHGYSKDSRPDLKQVTLQCVGMGKQALPIWMESLDGNSSDKKSFPETIARVDAFYKALEESPSLRYIADSALYGPALDALEVDWLTRVPENYKEAKQLCLKEIPSWKKLSDERYQVSPYTPSNDKERWLLVRSEPACQREKATFYRKHERIFDSLQKDLWHCSCQTFNCEKDAETAVKKVIRSKKHFYNVTYQILSEAKFNGKGRPSKDATPDSYAYKVEITGIASNYEAISEKVKTLGRFVLATNILDKDVMCDESMLLDYKEQSGVESGFKFIKNDAIGLDDVYLKKPERIAALMAIMTLCLLIYGITQQKLRETLASNNEHLPDKKSKPTQTPTLIWIFTLFSSITAIRLPQGDRMILNMQPLHEKVICLLGGNAKRIYMMPDDRRHQDIKLNHKTWLKWCGM